MNNVKVKHIKTADSIVVKILQQPRVVLTLIAEQIQGDEKLCKQYLLELYDQRHNRQTMIEIFGEELFNEIIDYVENHLNNR